MKLHNYRVIEKFTSIDGEGPSSGELSTFIRFLGCDLRCSWCDTKYSWDGSVAGEPMTIDNIYTFIKNAGATNVTLTGGEPLNQKNVMELIEFLSDDESLTIRIETHGGVNIKRFKERVKSKGARVQFVVDYKLPDSKMESRMDLENLSLVECTDTYKFVISSEQDLERAIQVVRDYGLIGKCHVYFSPVTDNIDSKLIVERMMAEKLNGVRFQLQLHKYIWPRDMRGV